MAVVWRLYSIMTVIWEQQIHFIVFFSPENKRWEYSYRIWWPFKCHLGLGWINKWNRLSAGHVMACVEQIKFIIEIRMFFFLHNREEHDFHSHNRTSAIWFGEQTSNLLQIICSTFRRAPWAVHFVRYACAIAESMLSTWLQPNQLSPHRVHAEQHLHSCPHSITGDHISDNEDDIWSFKRQCSLRCGSNANLAMVN